MRDNTIDSDGLTFDTLKSALDELFTLELPWWSTERVSTNSVTGIVELLALQARVRHPLVSLVPDPTPWAVSGRARLRYRLTRTPPLLELSTGLLRLLDNDELTGVIAHELGHIRLRHGGSTPTKEYEADRFALRLGYADGLTGALYKLGDYRPEWWNSPTDTHPSLHSRITRLNERHWNATV